MCSLVSKLLLNLSSIVQTFSLALKDIQSTSEFLRGDYEFFLLQLILPYRRYEADQVSAHVLCREAYVFVVVVVS